ncbi:MAG: low temperature requirement protein A [Gammaproteobacteria bacterium]|nr:low temperature requirement protein A [Gammaproteobacteria bacterium]
MSSNKPLKSVLINSLVSRDVNESHRPATALELFYDLIYVVAIASLAAELHHALSAWHHVGHAVLMYVFIFFCIWWPWNTYTWFASGYDTDDAQFRLSSFAQMIGVIIIAAGVKPAFVDNNFIIMMIGYATMRVPYILMWLKVAYDDVDSRPVAIRYASGVFFVQIAWSLSILYFQSWTLFIALLLCELLIPYIAEHSVDKGQNNKYHFGHIEERLGLLTIIVLGESMLAVVYAVQHLIKDFSADLLTLSASAVLILFSMWWLYFDDTVDDALASEKKAFIWGYGHYFIYGFAAAVGVLISVNVDVLANAAKINADIAVIGLSLMIAGYLVSVWLCHDYLLEKKGLQLFELLILAALVIGIAYFFHSILLISLSFVVLNVIRLSRDHKQLKLKRES